MKPKEQTYRTIERDLVLSTGRGETYYIRLDRTNGKVESVIARNLIHALKVLAAEGKTGYLIDSRKLGLPGPHFPQ